MIAGRIDRQPHDLHVSTVELWLNLCHIAEFGRADRREVLRVREEHCPGVADPIMEADPALGRFRLEIWCYVTDFHCSSSSLSCLVLKKIFSNPEAKVNLGVQKRRLHINLLRRD
jgi:hypothetical protein